MIPLEDEEATNMRPGRALWETMAEKMEGEKPAENLRKRGENSHSMFPKQNSKFANFGKIE